MNRSLILTNLRLDTIFTGVDNLTHVQTTHEHWLFYTISHSETLSNSVKNRLSATSPGAGHRALTDTRDHNLATIKEGTAHKQRFWREI